MAFWELPLEMLSRQQWEALCDGCGRCCHQKYEDEDSGELFLTNVACALFDDQHCRCRDYAHRQQRVPECMDIRQMPAEAFAWLPESCAYRLRAQGMPLPTWHPLRTGRPESVHEAGVSMKGLSVYENKV